MSPLRMLCVCTVLAMGSAASSYGNSGQTRMSVEWHDARLTVNADGVPFRELLAAFANKTAVEVQGLSTLKGSISVHFSNLTLRDGLEALLAQINYAIVGDLSAHGSEGRIVVIAVGHKLGSDSRAFEGQVRGGTPHTSEPVMADEPDTYQAVERMAEQADVGALREAAASGGPTTQALAMQRLARQNPAEARRVAAEVARSAEATQRVLAVQVLGGLDGSEVMNALGAALMDPDTDVRRAALVGLTGQRSPAVTQLLVQALQDSVESIRLLAQELLAQRGVTGM